MTYTRITKRQARKHYSEGKLFIICPCKIYPGGPFGMSYHCYPKPQEQTFDAMINHWKWYNTCYEIGYYAHFYIEALRGENLS